MKKRRVAWALILVSVLVFSYHWRPPRWWPQLPKARGVCLSAVFPLIDWRVPVARIIGDTTKRAVEFYWDQQDGAGLYRIAEADTQFVPFDSIYYEVVIWDTTQIPWTYQNFHAKMGFGCGRWVSGEPGKFYRVRGRAFGLVVDSLSADTTWGPYGEWTDFNFPSVIALETTLVPMGIIRIDTVDVEPDTIGGGP